MSQDTDLRKLAESGTNEEIEIYLENVSGEQFRKDIKNISKKEFTFNDWIIIVCTVFNVLLVGALIERWINIK